VTSVLDPTDFDAHARRIWPALARAAYLIIRDAQEAEDLAQEALVRVYRAAPPMGSTAQWNAYAYRTLVRLTRRRSRLARFSAERLTASPPDSARHDGPEVSDLEYRVRLELSRLPIRQRQTLVLRYFVDLSEQDTARVMRCSVGTVKSQASRGLATLRASLGSPATVTHDERKER